MWLIYWIVTKPGQRFSIAFWLILGSKYPKNRVSYAQSPCNNKLPDFCVLYRERRF